MKHLKRHYCYN